MKKNKQYYTLNEVEEYVKNLMSEAEKTKSMQAQKIEELEKTKKQLTKTIDEFKQKEKTINRTLVLAERRAEYILNNTRTRAVIELNRLTEFSVKWEKFFDDLDRKYDEKDREYNFYGFAFRGLILREDSDCEGDRDHHSQRHCHCNRNSC